MSKRSAGTTVATTPDTTPTAEPGTLTGSDRFDRRSERFARLRPEAMPNVPVAG